jgi:hypothetical protein
VQQQLFAVIEVPDHDHPDRMPLIVVMARIVGDNVVIDADATDRPLYEALLIAGIPRENLILGYLGETEPGEPTA